MTRFDAETTAERIALVAETIEAHRERGSQFCTVEADEDPRDDPDFLPPWVQFADGVLNLDCTDEEVGALERLLVDFGAFTISAKETEEEAAGTNVRIEARSDPDRVGQFVDAVFREVYDLPEDFTLWTVEI